MDSNKESEAKRKPVRRKGALLLTDVVDYTPQSNQLGSEVTAAFNRNLKTRLTQCAEKHGGETIKTIGDAVLLFLPDETRLPAAVTELRDLSFSGKLDEQKFIAKLRFVAHYGSFAFEELEDKLADLVGPEGIKVFRIEKYADAFDVVITGFLYKMIRHLLPEADMAAEVLEKVTLKGFDETDTLYKLVFPETGDGESRDPLELEMELLEADTREIPVFGDIYPAMNMEDHFINLDIHTGGGEPDRGCSSRRNEWLEIREPLHRAGRLMHTGDHINAKMFYDKFLQGVILGLPGSGKTTLLKYFAYREFKNRRQEEDGTRKRVVLFIPCRHGVDYETWYGVRYGKKRRNPEPPDRDHALAYLAYHFLRDHAHGQEGAGGGMRHAERLVQNAFRRGRLTLLVDALDEAPNLEVKDDLVQAVKVLWEAIGTPEEEQTSIHERFRIYLTARYSERERYFEGKKARVFQPRFEVKPLDMEQLRDMARFFLGEKSEGFKSFDQVVWKEEVAHKVGRTPLTALLVIAFFDTFGLLDTRYNMYRVIVAFILIRVWKQIKEDEFEGDMKNFFRDARSKMVWDRVPRAREICDALSLLCYECGRGGGVLTEEEILHTLELFAGRMEKGTPAGKEAEKWLHQLREDHLLAPAGPSRYVFIHATVTEFLAARFIVERIQDPNYLDWVFRDRDFPAHLAARDADFFESEALPIAVGCGEKVGTTLLNLVREKAETAKTGAHKERFRLLGVRALAELEGYMDRQYQRKRAPYMHRDMEAVLQVNRPALDWVYRGLGELFTIKEPGALQKTLETYSNISRLSLSDFPDRFLVAENFFTGGAELTGLRKRLLYRLVQREQADRWLEIHEKEEAGRPLPHSLLTLDTADYHPEDRNLAYYREYTLGTAAGFLGSPNLKHSHFVTCTVVSPDGKHLLSGSWDGTLKLWNADSGKEVHTFKGHTRPVNSVCFSPDGSPWVLSGSDDKTIKLWDTASGKEIQTYEGHTRPVNSVCFSPGGSRVLSGSDDKTIKLWGAASGKEIQTFKGHTGEVNSVCFSSKGSLVLSGSDDKTIKLWEVKSDRVIRTFTRHTGEVNSVCFSPKDSEILSGSDDGTVKLWDIETGKETQTFEGHDGAIWSVCFSPDGSRVISSSSDQTMRLWDIELGQKIQAFKGHDSYVRSVCFSPDGSRLFSGSYDRTVRLWEPESGEEIRVFKGHNEEVNSVHFSPDGFQVISGSSDETVKLWEAGSGKEIRTFKGHNGYVRSVCFSPDGSRALSGSSDHTVKLWEAETGKGIRTFKGHTNIIYSVCFSPDGSRVLSGSSDHTVKLWEAETGKEIRTFTEHSGTVVCFSPDGSRVLSGSFHNTVKLREVESGKVIRTFTGHTDYVRSVCFSPDGSRVLSGSNDRTLKLWDAESGREIRTFNGHSKKISTVLFPREFPYIVSGSEDFTLKLWDPDTGACIETIPLPWRPEQLAQHPTKPSFFACANANHTVTFFDFEKYSHQSSVVSRQ